MLYRGIVQKINDGQITIHDHENDINKVYMFKWNLDHPIERHDYAVMFVENGIVQSVLYACIPPTRRIFEHYVTWLSKDCGIHVNTQTLWKDLLIKGKVDDNHQISVWVNMNMCVELCINNNEVIIPYLTREFCELWYIRVCMRKLYLLGLTRKEIKACIAYGWDNSESFNRYLFILYDTLHKNPLHVDHVSTPIRIRMYHIHINAVPRDVVGKCMDVVNGHIEPTPGLETALENLGFVNIDNIWATPRRAFMINKIKDRLVFCGEFRKITPRDIMSKQVSWICGKSGTGKSTLVQELVKIYPKSSVVVYPFNKLPELKKHVIIDQAEWISIDDVFPIFLHGFKTLTIVGDPTCCMDFLSLVGRCDITRLTLETNHRHSPEVYESLMNSGVYNPSVVQVCGGYWKTKILGILKWYNGMGINSVAVVLPYVDKKFQASVDVLYNGVYKIHSLRESIGREWDFVICRPNGPSYPYISRAKLGCYVLC